MSRKRERGVALLATLAVIALLASYVLVSRLNAESGGTAAANRIRNAAVLNQAKQALISYVAAQAVKTGENRPGALPCPEAPANFNNPANEGTVSYPCTLPIVGRFPWRTLGLDKLVDTSGEPLWYAVATGWAGANTVINSNCASPTSGMACATGRLTVDGVTNDVVALIIAPGAAISVSASVGCAAWPQVRPTTAPPNWQNYLECDNATPTDASFVTTGPSGSFNDQVIRVTAADVLPAIEAAIAIRIEREIAPVLKTVYADATKWGTSPTNPAFPFAAPFGDPTTSNYQGQADEPGPPPVPALYRGLLPFNHSTAGCNPASDPRCAPTLVSWTTPRVTQTGGTGAVWGAPSCVVSATYSYCQDWYIGGTVRLTYEDIMANVAKALRTYAFNPASYYMETWAYNYDTSTWNFIASGTPSGQTRHFNTDGSFSIAFGAPVLPQFTGWGYYYVYVTRNAFTFSDHPLLSASDPTTGWFVRNEWYRLLYYAIAPNHAPGGSLSCTSGSNCLTVANVTPAGAQRAILILAGRSINGSPRPSATLGNYLEFGNATSAFERQTISTSVAAGLKRPFNDRIVAIDSNP